MHAMDTKDVRVRVLPHYSIDQSMLGPDGVTLLEPHGTTYSAFLASQIADMIAYFESRTHRTRGEVDLTTENPGNVSQFTSPPQLNWGTPNSSSASWRNTSHHSTPSKPPSGVSTDVISRTVSDLIFYLLVFFFSSLVTRLVPRPSSCCVIQPLCEKLCMP
jgi:hypothetical protein